MNESNPIQILGLRTTYMSAYIRSVLIISLHLFLGHKVTDYNTLIKNSISVSCFFEPGYISYIILIPHLVPLTVDLSSNKGGLETAKIRFGN